jgi:uncharacterized protein (DUF305 family)
VLAFYLNLNIFRSLFMNSWFFHPKTRLGCLILTAIALGSIISSCNTIAQTSHGNHQAPSSPKMSHEGMNHGNGTHHNMDLGPADADYDLRFIDAMIPHHEGALVMAKDLLEKSKRPELQKLAKNIIAAQDKEIAQMKKWRQTWYPKAPDTPMAWHAEMNHMMAMSPEQIKAMRMDVDLGSADKEYDLRFINGMIPHHEGAVVMAKDLLQKSKRPELQKLAKAIITSQQTEIDQMKKWRQTWYKQ